MPRQFPADHCSAPVGHRLPTADIDESRAASDRDTGRRARARSRAVPFNSPRRDGLPLPALTVEHAVSQLIWRALGPRPDAVRPLLAWAGGGAAAPREAGLTAAQLQYRVQVVQAVGQRTPIALAVATDLMNPAATSETAVRARRLYRLPRPGPVPASVRQAAVTAARVLAAVGPLPATDLQAAVARTRLHSHSTPPTEHGIEECLVLTGARYDQENGTWSAPAGTRVWPRDRALLDHTDPRVVYTRRELAERMITAGYAPGNAYTNALDTHPLIRRLSPNRYWRLPNS